MPDQLNYYIAEAFDDKIFTAGIVRRHQELIMQQQGFKQLKFDYSMKGSFFKMLRVLQCIKMALGIPAKSTVYFHFPFLAGVHYLLHQLLHIRGIKTVALIIDIDGLRDDDPALLRREIKALSPFTCLVVHNDAMKNYLVSCLPGAAVLSIQLFDYQFKGEPAARNFSNGICFAGNLAKSSFVYDLAKLKAPCFYLYGENFKAQENAGANLLYQGTVEPELLPAVLKGSFGLVWDGDSIEHCHQYLLNNNPHKLSLYLAAGLPVIVWRKSAVAAFVQQQGIGVTVSSLYEMETALQQLSKEQYVIMQQNAAAIALHLKEGFFLKSILAQLQK